MASWLSRTYSSHQVQLGATAVISGVVAVTAILGFQHLRRQIQIEDLKSSIPNAEKHDVKETQVKLNQYGVAPLKPTVGKEEERSAALAARAQQGDYDDDLILEQLARNRVFLTDHGLSKLRSSFIIVVGCGGVGSHATAALARSGVSKIRLIDFDQVTLSSLNRHALATLSDVGTPKVHCIRKRIEQITPWVRFDCVNELFNESSAQRQLGPWDGQEPDYIIDAIDNIDSKVALLNYCYKHSKRVISSMGAGCKSDPTRVFIGDISASTEDPLSRTARRRLRALGVKEGLPVVFSTEKPGPGKAQLLPLPDEEFAKGSVNELGVLPDFRVRILPVLGTMPAVFGYIIANHLILEVTGYPHEYSQGKGRDKMYEGILASLQAHEERLVKYSGKDFQGLKIPVTKDDVGYLVEEVFKGRSVVSGLSTRLTLVRWNGVALKEIMDTRFEGQKYSRLKLTDLVCMTKEEAALHEREVLKDGKGLKEVYGLDVIRLAERRLQEVVTYEQYR
ncbi:MAG: hypothetical protein M1835_000776 [Candelina submexicana]|nr:MAG: hypothetical protein M1835_000776 [Candelina submexicana]